jgi:pimeloyl-ACP methyl ester carboxylesterase
LRSARQRPAYEPAAITVPVLTAHGTESREHHCWAAEELARLTGGDAPFVIDGAGHGAHASHHREFADFTRRVVVAGR